jgi:predicted nucleic acid-binding protein
LYSTAERLIAAPLVIRTLESALQAWVVADELGWARTYDAEYVALARSLECRLVTLDERLRRGAGRVVEVIGPADV